MIGLATVRKTWRAPSELRKDFNPDEPRDEQGRWTSESGAVIDGSVGKDKANVDRAMRYFKPGELKGAVIMRGTTNMGRTLATTRGKRVIVAPDVLAGNPQTLAAVLYHENVHVNQPPGMTTNDKELQAHSKTAAWAMGRQIEYSAGRLRPAEPSVAADFDRMRQGASAEASRFARRRSGAF